LRENLGTVVRGVAASGEEAIITDNGTEVAAIIPIGRLWLMNAEEASGQRAAFLQRFNEGRGIHTTGEGLAAMQARLERFEAGRRGRRDDAA
jgi:antitoxin (DNA-binding transcriptional repressor) of toxin-antitoxin stability system